MKKLLFLFVTISLFFIVACGNGEISSKESECEFQEEETSVQETTTMLETTVQESTTQEETTVEETTTQIETTTVEETTIPEETTKEQVVSSQSQFIVVIEQPVDPINITEYDEAYIIQKIEELKTIYPEGKYWNRGGVTDIPCTHSVNDCINCNVYKSVINSAFPYVVQGGQCVGFASICSDYIFGLNAPTKVFNDYESLEIGDFIRTAKERHSALVIDKCDEYITVVECNADYQTCKITWGRQLTRKYLEENESWYIKRY